MTTIDDTTAARWHAMTADDVASALDVRPGDGLASDEASLRLQRFGRNEIPAEPPPSARSIAVAQTANPMNVMLLAVAAGSFVIGEIGTGVVVGLLVLLNVWMGTRQELKALASVDALSQLQVATARVRRDGSVGEIDATGLVPGDVLLLEAGEAVPADGRIVVSATLETQEAALTGESLPVAKDPEVPDAAVSVDGRPDSDGGGEVALGDRTNLVFQNTLVTRGTATVVVTQTGASTQMGQIADMVSATHRKKSPLQLELDGMTKVFGAVAWLAVAIIAIAGIARGQDTETLVLLCVSTAIAAIPTGMPTFVQTMLSSGARHLADERAVVKSLNDVETLGGTTAINSDKTGTLTMNAMTATSMFAGGEWFRVQGVGYSTSGSILHVAGSEMPDLRRLGFGLALCSDATVSVDETVVGDPTEAALVVLAAKMGVDAEETRRALPRRAEVPFDSAHKFMATYHDVPDWMETPHERGTHFVSVKGAPGVVLDRCDRALWHGEIVPVAEVRDEIMAANRRLGEEGLRVLSFAARGFDTQEMDRAAADPMAAVGDLVFVALVGIIDPLRPSAKEAVRIARGAGIDVRMITGDHTVTARAIADDLGLGAGVISGTDFAARTDDDLLAELPHLHVFGRVAPEDKVRLVRLMQEEGEVVAMTGDAVNDAASLKQADVGVAMGSGSEVTQQAAKMILTDDNFSTLVRAVELGRDVYRRITTYVRLQLTVLSSVLQLMVLATVLNVNEGVALFPLMLLFCKMFVVATIVIGLLVDVPDPDVMDRPPRVPGTRIVNRHTMVGWLVSGFIVAASALAVLSWGPDEPSTTDPSTAMTMAFGIVALSAVNMGLVLRRERQGPFTDPLFPYLGWVLLGWGLTWAAIELQMLQRVLGSVPLTGAQWALVIGLSLVAPAFGLAQRQLSVREPA